MNSNNYYGTSINHIELNCNLDYKNGTTTYLKAINSIELRPGFKTSQGGIFHAQVQDCIYQQSSLKSSKAIAPINIGKYEEININVFNKEDIKVYPNPTNGIAFIDCLGQIPDRITIYNSMGSPINAYIRKDPLIKIDLSEFSTGFYFIILDIDNHQIQKVIVKF